jgi:hypothetical protein
MRFFTDAYDLVVIGIASKLVAKQLMAGRPSAGAYDGDSQTPSRPQEMRE